MGKKKNQQKEEEIESEDGQEVDNEQMQADVAAQLQRMMNPHFAEQFVEKLEPCVQKRVHALQGLQKQIQLVREQYIQEHKEIEKKYEALFEPFLELRKHVTSGEHEPTDEEVIKGSGDFLPSSSANEVPSGVKGIPKFWLKVLQNNGIVSDMIQDRDVPCLETLNNVVAKNFDDPDTGFFLEFHFDENDFFTNKVLTKTYKLLDEDEVVLDKAEGCEISWKPNNNLTVVLTKKKQKAKGGKGTRTVTKEEPCESFFNFFKPPQPPAHDTEEEDEDEDDMDELEELIEADYEIGQIIKDSIIPRAIMWFTGELEEELDDDESDEEDEEDSEDDDEDDSDERGAGGRGGGRGGRGGGGQQQRGGGGGRGGRGGGGGEAGGGGGRGGYNGKAKPSAKGAPGEAPECKQQ